jgi:hypothetical protein
LEDGMSKPGFTVFLLFFGVALLDAVQGGAWPRIAFWVGAGIAFWLLERWGLSRRQRQ